MFFKKYILMLSLAVVTVLFIPNLASAKTTDLLAGKQFYKNNYGKGSIYKGNEDSYGYLYAREVIADLGKESYIKNFTYSAQGGIHFAYLSFYDSNFRMVRTVKTDGPRGNFSVLEKARYVVVGNSGRDSTQFSWVSVYGDDGFVSDVSNLKANPEANKVTLNWKNPEGEENFKGLRIYQGNKFIAELDNTAVTYVVEGLKANESHVFTVKSIDQNKVETKGASVKVNTLTPLIDPPKNVYVTPQNGSLIINWESVNSPYLKGYNVYIDGKKITDELLTSNKLILNNLENDKKYSVQISVVNSENKEGNKSAAVTESPSKDATMIEYDLKPPLTAMELLETAGTIVLWLSPFILVGIVIIWFKPLKELIVKAVLDHKKKGEKK
ncbi:fibronectin type III domain-containing protein [Bacillus toyonensis]|uniref:fibronectin type III domain-containing protein n=1 Tax=Bacillus toyonensis TaxID=155322 RepID=UPI0021CF16E2|nr:fibronectin type III domain-containing protein [Bacillus toyonensis]MCU5182580.1 fibronectin type III domain-containing protein [Bacillus toyonensis]